MSFEGTLAAFTAAVEAGDGRGLAAVFSEDGIYHDTFYGEFRGRDAIADMLEKHFWRDADSFRWDMLEPARAGNVGYARWIFSYRSKLPDAEGKRIMFEGMSRFALEGDLIRHYGEVFDMGIALSQTNFAPERIGKIVAKAARALRARQAGSRHLPEGD